MRFLRKLEWLLLMGGLLMVGIYIATRIHGTVGSTAELQKFKKQIITSTETPASFWRSVQLKPDFRLWSSNRIADYEQAIDQYVETPLGVLRIPKVRLEVPVVAGTDDLSLNIGVGHIEGTVSPGQDGNIGIAGHRDGFFRVLKDVAQGDAIELQSVNRTDTYMVDRVVIVETDDVSVLRPRPRPSLTLVTCYPFYFVGSAPKRYIVQASLTHSEPAKWRVTAHGIPDSTHMKQAEATQ